MKHATTILLALLVASAAFAARIPEALVADGIPVAPDPLAAKISPYLDYRTASLSAWHPERREMLISTRFAHINQVHRVEKPGGARTQLTFFDERVGGASYSRDGRLILFLRDEGGSEFYQLYRMDTATAEIAMLTDGKSRNGGPTWSHGGEWIAWTSTRRNGTSNDVWVMKPSDPSSARMLVEATSGGSWSATDWSPDDTSLVIVEYISANQSNLYVVDFATGKRTRINPESKDLVSWGGARFTRDGKSLITTTDQGREFRSLVRFDLASNTVTPLSAHIPWDVAGFDLQGRHGDLIAFITNEAGVGVLHLFDLAKNVEVAAPGIPQGIPSGLEFHENGVDLGFNLSSARSTTDIYSVDVDTGEVTRWTASETGGLDLTRNSEPELVTMKSFDGLEISAFVYRPDQKTFPGPRPVMISIHGGPEGQSRPGFLGRNNYLINEMGIALVYPNVRGSSGYGKTYLQLDNGVRREDSVKDIGAVIAWVKSDPRLDGERISVYGGSYGGYMVLASLLHFGDRLRCGIEAVGISDFATFLTNTQSYRRDLRRVEYGDERDPEMRKHFEKISPLRQASKIDTPLFVIAGLNDPRVPASESEQIVKAVRANGRPVWYLLGKNEGHGFQKKENQDYQFTAMVMFLEEHLVGDETKPAATGNTGSPMRGSARR